MFSEELYELDRNTMKLMVDEMQDEIDELQRSKDDLQKSYDDLQKKLSAYIDKYGNI